MTRHYRPHPSQEEQRADAESRFESALNHLWRNPKDLQAAIDDATGGNTRLAEIALIARAGDFNEAGRQFDALVSSAAHDYARVVACCEEHIEPSGGWKPTRSPLDDYVQAVRDVEMLRSKGAL